MRFVSRACFTACLLVVFGAVDAKSQTNDAGLIESDRQSFKGLLADHAESYQQGFETPIFRLASFLQDESDPSAGSDQPVLQDASGEDDASKTLRDAMRALRDDVDASDSINDDASDMKDDSSDEEEDGVGDDLGSKDRIPELVHGRFHLPELKAVTINTDDVGTGKLPDGFRGDQTTPATVLPESGAQRMLGGGELPWEWQVLNWTAANTFSHPRYFEDRMLERHGHQRFRYLQPAVSGIRFFTGTVMLPYLATVNRPCDCEYTLGYYRSGSCVHTYLQRPPLERKAVAAQGLAIGTYLWVLP